MPILIMGLVALLIFVTIVVLVCSAGMAERQEREVAETRGPTFTPPPVEETPAPKTKAAA